MPARDNDPDRESARPSERWGAEPPRESSRRDAERRLGASAFSRDPRSTGPADSGNSPGGLHEGRGAASARPGSRSARDEHPEMRSPGGMDSADFSPSVYDRSQARQAPTGDWDRAGAERRAGTDAARRSRSWQPATASSRPAQGAGLARPDDSQFDADYRQWREEQMRLLDLDYAQWRRERYRKFAEEFSQWRSQRLQSARPAQAAAAGTPEPTLGELSPLGTPPSQEPPREPPPAAERERPGGGLLGGLLGGHADRHKPRP